MYLIFIEHLLQHYSFLGAGDVGAYMLVGEGVFARHLSPALLLNCWVWSLRSPNCLAYVEALCVHSYPGEQPVHLPSLSLYLFSLR